MLRLVATFETDMCTAFRNRGKKHGGSIKYPSNYTKLEREHQTGHWMVVNQRHLHFGANCQHFALFPLFVLGKTTVSFGTCSGWRRLRQGCHHPGNFASGNSGGCYASRSTRKYVQRNTPSVRQKSSDWSGLVCKRKKELGIYAWLTHKTPGHQNFRACSSHPHLSLPPQV